MKSTADVIQTRLIEFGVAVCVAARRARRDVVGLHIVRQVIRSATSPAACYAEARGAESRRDFVHKMQIALKELRETSVWLQFLARLGGAEANAPQLNGECNQLIAIFARSVQTAKAANRRQQIPDS